MRPRISSVLAIFLGLAHSTGYAWPPIYGPEWEFTNATIDGRSSYTLVNSGANVAARNRMTREILNRCTACWEEKVPARYGLRASKIVFPELDHWYVIVNVDPAVVEVQAKPLSLAEFARHAPAIQTLIFDSAAAVGIHPSWELGAAGHVHISLQEAFDGNARLFRDFIVDFHNHPELAMGALAEDLYNAPSLGSLSEGQIDSFKQVIARFDGGDIRTIQELANEINRRVYYTSVEGGFSPGPKYQALNLQRVTSARVRDSARTVEIRSLRAQRSMKEFLLVLELFQKRLEFLAARKDPVPVTLRGGGPTRAEAAESFRAYVQEMGADWKAYQSLLTPHCQSVLRSK